MAAADSVKIQQMIRERGEKIQALNDSVRVSRRNADREIAHGGPFFTRIKDVTDMEQARMTKMIEDEHRMMEEQVGRLSSELEQEISALQNISSLSDAPNLKDWSKLKPLYQSYRGRVKPAVDELVRRINEMFLVPELKTVQQFAVDVTLDPDTAHPELAVSDDGKQVHHDPKQRMVPDNPQRFSTGLLVLGKQVCSSGRFYFEVEVKGKTQWEIGVANESVNRKGPLAVDIKNGYWALRKKNENEYYSFSTAPIKLSPLSKPDKVGVFVDYEEGLISFHDVDSAHPISCIIGRFTEKLCPFFGPGFNLDGKNSAPLIICPVKPE